MTETSRQKSMQQQSISIRNRFHVTLRIVCPTIWKQCLRMKGWKDKIKVVKANKLKTAMNQSIHKLRQLRARFSNNCVHWNFKSNWRKFIIAEGNGCIQAWNNVWFRASEECVSKTASVALATRLHRAPSNKAVIGEASDVSSTSVVKKVSNSSNGQSNSGMQRPTKRLRAWLLAVEVACWWRRRRGAGQWLRSTTIPAKSTAAVATSS